MKSWSMTRLKLVKSKERNKRTWEEIRKEWNLIKLVEINSKISLNQEEEMKSRRVMNKNSKKKCPNGNRIGIRKKRRSLKSESTSISSYWIILARLILRTKSITSPNATWWIKISKEHGSKSYNLRLRREKGNPRKLREVTRPRWLIGPPTLSLLRMISYNRWWVVNGNTIRLNNKIRNLQNRWLPAKLKWKQRPPDKMRYWDATKISWAKSRRTAYCKLCMITRSMMMTWTWMIRHN